jgi:hypothetical protein
MMATGETGIIMKIGIVIDITMTERGHDREHGNRDGYH